MPAVEPMATPERMTPATNRGTGDVVSTPSAGQARLSKLVAGTVRSDINRGYGFDGDLVDPAAHAAARGMSNGSVANQNGLTSDRKGFSLYTRKAEHVEAATRHQVGSLIDLQG